MNEKPESEEFDEDKRKLPRSQSADFDRPRKSSTCEEARPEARRSPVAPPRTNRRRKRVAELTSDFDDYNIDDETDRRRKMNPSKRSGLTGPGPTSRAPFPDPSAFAPSGCRRASYASCGMPSPGWPHPNPSCSLQVPAAPVHGPHRRGVQGRRHRNCARLFRFGVVAGTAYQGPGRTFASGGRVFDVLAGTMSVLRGR